MENVAIEKVNLELKKESVREVINKQIIISLLETDLYKLSMGQAIFHQFNEYRTTWTFKCRNKNVVFTRAMVKEIKRQIKLYCKLRFNENELEYLKNIPWLKPSYINFLRLWHPRFKDFDIRYDENVPSHLVIKASGTWLDTSMYEIPTLAIVNEVYFRMNYDYNVLFKSFEERLDLKIKGLISGKYRIGTFSEFGLRRRLSSEAQELAVAKLKENNPKFKESYCVGTSNVYLAMKYDMKPVGTMAHEWIMCVGQGMHDLNPAYSNFYALRAWVKEYGVLNGIALTDTVTTDCFLLDFDNELATLYSGVRHDSGNPFDWGRKVINHYKSLNIDPKTKTLLFSDSLDFEKATKIYDTFKGEINVAFGIGTFLSNDTCVDALNIVMKVTEANGAPVAKISDDEGKGMCKDAEYVADVKHLINRRITKGY